MEYKNIPGTDLNVSVLGLGTWVFGGEMWGGAQEKDAAAAVHAALAHGINLIDTAPVYGHGKSEEIVGMAIKGRRDQVVLATKCGLVSKGKGIVSDLSSPSIQKEIEESLKRLQTDYIDLYQCHWPDPATPIEETMEALNRLKEQGKIRHIGVSNFDLDLLKKAKALAPVVSLQSQFSLLERTLEGEMIPYCRENRVGILAYGVLGGGILTGKYQSPTRFKGGDARNFFYKYYEGEGFQKVQTLLARMKTIGRPLNQAALNWARQHEGITTALAGCRTAKQVEDNVAALEWELEQNRL